MMLVPCYLAPSMIEGLGVYATAAIRKGDLVWCFDERFDRLISKSDIETSPEHIRAFFDRYTYDLPGYPDHVVLDADEGRFMNHSDTPNCDFRDAYRAYALTDIPVGVELTCNYREFGPEIVEFQASRHHVGAAYAVVGHAE